MYIATGILTTFIWFLVSLILQKKNFNRSLQSSVIFATSYIIGYSLFYYLGKNNNSFKMPNLNIGICLTLVWFLYVLLIKKKSINKSLYSSGIFALYLIFAEFIYIFITKFSLPNMKTLSM